MSSRTKPAEAGPGLVPGAGRAAGDIGPKLEGIPDDGPDLRGGGDAAHGHGLDEDVADGRGLGRPGHDRPSGRVGGELAEQPVARTAADDVDRLDRMPEDALELSD